MPTRVLCAILLVLLAAASRADEPEPAADLRGLMRHYTLAARAEAAGDLDDARRRLHEGLVEIPASPHLLLILARVELSRADTVACHDVLAPVSPPPAPVVASLGDPELRTEGIAHDPVTGDLLARHHRPADADTLIHMWNDVSVGPDGTAHVIDVADGSARFLATPEHLNTGLGDGLARRDGHLFIVQNNPLLAQRVLHLKLTADGLGVLASEALTFGLPDGLMPYTCAAGDGVIYVNGTAPFAAYDGPDAPPEPVIVAVTYGLD